MKMIIALILTLILIAGGIVLEVTVHDTFSDLSDSLEAQIKIGEDAEYDIEPINEIASWWIKKHNFLEAFVPHAYLNEIEIVLGELQGAIKAEDYPTSTALLNRLYETSIAMESMFSLRIGNVL